MRIAAFNGSPRRGGNIEILLAEALRPMELAGHEIQKLTLNEMNIKPCQDCGVVRAQGSVS